MAVEPIRLRKPRRSDYDNMRDQQLFALFNLLPPYDRREYLTGILFHSAKVEYEQQKGSR